jgi:hypothetical protein
VVSLDFVRGLDNTSHTDDKRMSRRRSFRAARLIVVALISSGFAAPVRGTELDVNPRERVGVERRIPWSSSRIKGSLDQPPPYTIYNVWAQDSAEHLESFILADPGDRYSRLSLATLLVKSPGGEAHLEQILEPLPRSDPEATTLLIESRIEHGRLEEATAMLKDTAADHPNLARIRGRVALMSGDVAAAIHYFRDALTEEPYDRVAVSELGKALVLMGDKSAAESYLARARSLDTLYNLLNRVRRPDRENQASDLNQFGRACESVGLLIEARGWY